MKFSTPKLVGRATPLLLALLSPLFLWGQSNTAPIRVAIVSEQGAAPTVGDLLTAELSRNPELQLLERDQIAKVYREQTSSAGNRDYLKLGQVLGADGLLLLRTATEGTNNFLQARVVAVKPGVVINVIRAPWPVQDASVWTGRLVSHLDPMFLKLSVPLSNAVPISVVNLRSAVRSVEAETLERQLTALTIERLSREPELFVLERRRLELLSGEKELKDMGESAFWNGSYLLEGVIDRDGYAKDRLTIHVRLMPPAGTTPVELKVEGPRADENQVLEQIATKILEALKRTASALKWKPEAEAQKYLEEAKWAMRWQMLPEAQTALESCWALGLRNKEVSELRIRAWLGTGVNGNNCNIQRERGIVVFGRRFDNGLFDMTQQYFLSPPDPDRFDDLIYALRLFEQSFGSFVATQPKLDSEWLTLGNSLLVEASVWLRQYYFTVEARAGREEQIAEVRNLVLKIHASMQRHPGYAEADKNLSLMATRVISGVFWADTPEQTLGWYQEAMQSGQWPKVRARFFNNGHFRQEGHSISFNLGGTDNFNSARPPLGGWKWEDRQRAPAVWAKYLDDLCASTNVLSALEGQFIRCQMAWTGEEFEKRLNELLEAVWQQREVILAAKQETNWVQDLKVLALGRLGDLKGNQAARIKDNIWKDFEARFKELATSAEARAQFEKVKDFFKTQPTHDGLAVTRYKVSQFNEREAAELLPLVKEYKQRMGDAFDREATPHARQKKQLMESQVGSLEAKLAATLKPTPTNQPPATPIAPATPPVNRPASPTPPSQLPAVAGPMTNRSAHPFRPTPPGSPIGATPQPPPVYTNHLRVERFYSPKDFGWSWRPDLWQMSLDVCARDRRLWFQLQYDESDSYGHREPHCILLTSDEELRPGKILSLNKQISRPAGVPLPMRVFEVWNDALFVSGGDGLKKYSLKNQAWENLPAPFSGLARLQRLGNRLFATTDDSILELSADGTSKILASSRRQPPVTILDGVQGYSVPPFSVQSPGPPQLFLSGDKSLSVLVKGKVYVLPVGAVDWQIVELPAGASLPQIYEDGLFVGGSLPGDRRALWGMFNGSKNFEMLFVAQTERPWMLSVTFGRRDPALDAPMPKSRWKQAQRLPEGGTGLVPDGPNLWGYSGSLAIEVRDGRGAVKENYGCNGVLVGYLADMEQPLVIPLRLPFADDILERQSMNQIYGSGDFGQKTLRVTPKGLVLTREKLPGFWFIPRADLEKRIAEFRRAQPGSPVDNKVPAKR